MPPFFMPGNHPPLGFCGVAGSFTCGCSMLCCSNGKRIHTGKGIVSGTTALRQRQAGSRPSPRLFRTGWSSGWQACAVPSRRSWRRHIDNAPAAFQPGPIPLRVVRPARLRPFDTTLRNRAEHDTGSDCRHRGTSNSSWYREVASFWWVLGKHAGAGLCHRPSGTRDRACATRHFFLAPAPRSTGSCMRWEDSFPRRMRNS